jgi:hypothetical protein
MDLTGEEIRVLCTDFDGELRREDRFFDSKQCLRDLSNQDPVCEAPTSTYVDYAIRKDCAALASACPKMLEPDPWVEPVADPSGAVVVAGSVGEEQVDVKSGGSAPFPGYNADGDYLGGAISDSSAYVLWGSLKFKRYQGLLQFLSPTKQMRLICMDDVTAKFRGEPDWLDVATTLSVFESSSLSELSCGTGGSPLEISFDATQTVPSQPSTGTLDGEALAQVDASPPSCAVNECELLLGWGANPRRRASLVVIIDQPLVDLDPGEFEDLTIPFTSSYLLEGRGDGNVRCGGGGSMHYTHEFHFADQYTRQDDEHLDLQVDSLSPPSTCPGAPLTGALHGNH